MPDEHNDTYLEYQFVRALQVALKALDGWKAFCVKCFCLTSRLPGPDVALSPSFRPIWICTAFILFSFLVAARVMSVRPGGSLTGQYGGDLTLHCEGKISPPATSS